MAGFLAQTFDSVIEPALEVQLSQTVHDLFPSEAGSNKFEPTTDVVVRILSSSISGFLSSPLLLIQDRFVLFVAIVWQTAEDLTCRLIVQSHYDKCKKYHGVIDCGRTIVAEEGIGGLFKDGLFGAYLRGLFAFTSIAGSMLTQRLLGPSSDILTFVTCQFVARTCGLVFRLPLETVRHRLHCQLHRRRIEIHPPFRTAVPLSPVPYKGALDCLSRIVREEGVKSLYRGWRLHLLVLFSEVVVGALSLLEIESEEELDEELVL